MPSDVDFAFWPPPWLWWDWVPWDDYETFRSRAVIPRRDLGTVRLRFCGPCVRGEHSGCTGCDCLAAGTVCAGKPPTSA